jgi:hypothetical protein
LIRILLSSGKKSKKNLDSFFSRTFYLRKVMKMYPQTVISRKTNKKNNMQKISFLLASERPRTKKAGSGSIPICHESTTLGNIIVVVLEW